MEEYLDTTNLECLIEVIERMGFLTELCELSFGEDLKKDMRPGLTPRNPVSASHVYVALHHKQIA